MSALSESVAYMEAKRIEKMIREASSMVGGFTASILYTFAEEALYPEYKSLMEEAYESPKSLKDIWDAT
jgi:hypothetical protein